MINGLPAATAVSDVKVLHAGTTATDDGIVSTGGRVLSITATGPDLAAARNSAYAAVAAVMLPGSHYRTDIADAAAHRRVYLPGTMHR